MHRALVFVVLAFLLAAVSGLACDRGGAKPQAAGSADAKSGDAKAAKAGDAKAGEADGIDPALLDPFAATEQAPATFKVKFETTKGDFVVEVTRAWAPLGADRFYNLVKLGYFEDIAFFRVLDGFMAQFGLHGTPKVTSAWKTAPIKDDAVTQSNKRGTLSFATSGPNTRTTQLFINYNDNVPLDRMGFSPFGKVVEGMEVVDSLHKGYGEGAPKGSGPDQGKIEREGNAYLKARFPKLDYIERATLVQ
jgi:peptidyl-prolyl cis-trans isomerase A (cyclophilin A)